MSWNERTLAPAGGDFFRTRSHPASECIQQPLAEIQIKENQNKKVFYIYNKGINYK